METTIATQADQMITSAYMYVHHLILAGMSVIANSGYVPKEHITAVAREFHETVLPIVQQRPPQKDLPVYDVLNHISFNIVVVWVGFALAYGAAAGVWYLWTNVLTPVLNNY